MKSKLSSLVLLSIALGLQACGQGSDSNRSGETSRHATRDDIVVKVDATPIPIPSPSEDAQINVATLNTCLPAQYDGNLCAGESLIHTEHASRNHSELQPVNALFIPRKLPDWIEFTVTLPAGVQLNSVKHVSIDLESNQVHLLGFDWNDVVVSKDGDQQTLFVRVNRLAKPLEIARETSGTIRIMFWDEVVPFDQTPLEIIEPLYFQ